jgi:hypothetical protein
MKCILKFKKYFHMSQCYSGERYGPWASCFENPLLIDTTSGICNGTVSLIAVSSLLSDKKKRFGRALSGTSNVSL